MSCYNYCKYCKEYKKKQHNCRNDSKCNDNKDNLVRASAFRARNTVDQNVPANTFVKVLFQNEQFNLANEYNPETSILYRRLKEYILLLERLFSFLTIQGKVLKLFLQF